MNCKMGKVVLLFLFLTTNVSSGLLFPAIHQRHHPDLVKTSQSQIGKHLNIRLDVANKKDPSARMAIKGLVLKLTQNMIDNNKKKNSDNGGHYPEMPGSSKPSISSGLRAADVIQEGSFVDMTGMKNAHMENGLWEVVWKDNAPSGYLLFGLDVPQELRRNSAAVPEGNVFLSFPLWTKESLQEFQGRKAALQERATKYIKERKDALEKSMRANNPIHKAFHYRDAVAAAEKYSNCGFQSYDHVPTDAEELTEIGNDLFLYKQGVVWHKSRNAFAFPRSVVLGTAKVTENEIDPTTTKLRP